MWHLSGGQVPPTASMQPAGPPGRQLIEKDRLWETYRGRNPAYSRHHEPAATNESDRHVSYDLGWITSYYRGTEYYIYNIYIKYITWITLHLQKPKIRRIGARFENMFFFKKGHHIKGRVHCPDTLDTHGSAPETHRRPPCGGKTHLLVLSSVVGHGLLPDPQVCGRADQASFVFFHKNDAVK